MTHNKTATFLGPEYTWHRVQIELHDVQALHGGVRVVLPSFTAQQSFVTCYAPGGEETRYKLRLGWQEKKALCALCVAHDLLAIESEQRMGIPDEARPEITLTNAQRRSHTVALWAGAVADNERFAAVYQALLSLIARTAGQKPLARRLESGEKWLVLALAVAALAALAAAAAFASRALVDAWWTTRFGLLFGLLVALIVLLPAALVLLARRERHKPAWNRAFGNPFMLAAVNLFLFVGLVGATGMVEEAIAIWRGATVLGANEGRNLYGVLAYSGALGGWLALLAGGLVGGRMLDWLDERW